MGAEAHRKLMQQPTVVERPTVAAAGTPADEQRSETLPEPSPVAQAGNSSFADRKHTCTHPGCTTKISIYNSSTTCFAHS